MMSKAADTTWLARSNALFVLFGLFSILMSGTVGCRSARDNQIDLLERELRTQEDYIYELEDYVLEYSEKLRQVRCVQPHEIVTQARPLEPELEPSTQTEKQPVEEPADQLPEPQSPEPELDEIEDFSPEELDIPELELETSEPVGQLEELRDESQVEAEFAKGFDNEGELVFVEDDAVELASATDESLNEPLSEEEEHESEAEFLENLFDEEPADTEYRYAERLVIVDVFRGGQSIANSLRTGPASLLTVIEARDADDEPVDLDGKISLMIMTADPVSPQRLKRWDFSVEETAAAWQSSQLGDGLHLELPLDDSVESEEPVELWVRLVKADGRKLLAQLPLHWEQLVSVEAAMDTPQHRLADEDQFAENEARPLQRQELAGLQSEKVHELARADKKKSSQAGSRWRKSLQRTHMNTEGYSSTASAAKGWMSQPTGGREPLSRPATVGHSATTVRQAAMAPQGKKPTWTAGRNSRKKLPQEEERPQWAPPK